MFTGIIEEKAIIRTINQEPGLEVIRIGVARPTSFDDVKTGDSIACNGVCLTIETLTDREMVFALGFETLNLVKWTAQDLQGKTLNLERSLRLGDRIHGHLVSGHVEAVGKVQEVRSVGSNIVLVVHFPSELSAFLWKKGSITINGVSLTVNSVENQTLEVCLIPETIKRTNLGELMVGDSVNLEPDYFAKSIMHYFKGQMAGLPSFNK